jgi:hypothetical protein
MVAVGFAVTSFGQGSGPGRPICVQSGTDLRCWGHATEGQLGYGNVNVIGDNETPASAGNVPYD